MLLLNIFQIIKLEYKNVYFNNELIFNVRFCSLFEKIQFRLLYS